MPASSPTDGMLCVTLPAVVFLCVQNGYCIDSSRPMNPGGEYGQLGLHMGHDVQLRAHTEREGAPGLG